MGCIGSSIDSSNLTTTLKSQQQQQLSIETMPKTSQRSRTKRQQQQKLSTNKKTTPSSSLLNKKMIKKFLTLNERNQIITNGNFNHSSTKLLLCSPFSNFSQYTRRLFLTGFSGLIPENLNNNNIGFVIILAKELSNLISTSSSSSSTKINVEIFKFFLPESLTLSIYNEFDKIIDLIDRKIRENNDKNAVVCCTAGMSRSSTIVMAYAIKYLGVTLKIAFQQLQQSRQYSRPNRNYFQQLIQYEYHCLGRNSVNMIEIDIDIDNNNDVIKNNNNKSMIKKLKLPDIYSECYTDILKYEQNIYYYNLKIINNNNNNNNNENENEYTGELRPFIIEQYSYETFYNELQSIRQQQQQ